ncbi:xanthine dehydrogenase family protein molybdopterin-binding subunit [Chelatococcus sambhunathii]|uniref:Xanthine dehydrogenase family protein molybdopterin-binding subunit n=1 Tax=Chelatococcus sambhunathii TaxID=363953 RepID=A0ABU1DKA1_9HYPH|nr:xanthine dehydrogenase family protein molybdopterin-binding subunit [Chelatococcus sambhunathii]MDR4308552.1 xanthine dehydrogenase family protein molybdopterin-binding subunit [Chelatococcus sambhunathii]
MSNVHPYVGRAQPRVDGPLKVSGLARYSAEFAADDLVYAAAVPSTIAKGRIVRIDASAAQSAPGVVEILTHENRPNMPAEDEPYKADMVAVPGGPFRPLRDDRIWFSGQPAALVIADTHENARHAATLVKVEYEALTPEVDVSNARDRAYDPPEKRNGIPPPPPPRGDAEATFKGSVIRLEEEYRVSAEHHNPMELQATTVEWDDGRLVIHNKTQGVNNPKNYVCSVFGLDPEAVQVSTPFVGGAFGMALRPHYDLTLAVMAALKLKRSVRLVLTRGQMYTMGWRPDTLQTVALSAGEDGRLTSVRHEVIQATSQFEDYQEPTVNWSGLVYDCPNVTLGHKLAKVDTSTPSDMRAPGATLGMFALETAMDELSYKLKLDPLELRLKNYAEADQNDGKPFSSKELKAAYETGAERFRWSKRSPEPRSMKEGRELVGYGMATGCWEAMMQPHGASAALTADGRLEVACGTADIGTGTYTILTQIGADAFSMPIEEVTALVGDTRLPMAPVEGGSWAAASAGNAVRLACAALKEELVKRARGLDDSPLANASVDHVVFRDGRIALASDENVAVSYAKLLGAAEGGRIEAMAKFAPDKEFAEKFSSYTHSAVFAEVRVDEELGVVRVERIVSAIAAGKILNLATARSQILGGVVMGIGMALHEETKWDKRLGRIVNANLGEYHVPAHADVKNIDVIFVDEEDDANPLGVKGLGEIGIVGAAAAIGNAVFHATGRRVRHLPITIDKLL